MSDRKLDAELHAALDLPKNGKTPAYSSDLEAAWAIVEAFDAANSDDLYNELAQMTPLIAQDTESAALTICYAARIAYASRGE